MKYWFKCYTRLTIYMISTWCMVTCAVQTLWLSLLLWYSRAQSSLSVFLGLFNRKLCKGKYQVEASTWLTASCGEQPTGQAARRRKTQEYFAGVRSTDRSCLPKAVGVRARRQQQRASVAAVRSGYQQLQCLLGKSLRIYLCKMSHIA